ncbi:MAG: ArdC family protein [Clostridiaceae bacterium]
MTRTKPHVDVARLVSDLICDALERGVVPWKKPWTSLPVNMASGREYHGINLMLLALSPFASPFYLTFNQIEAMGGRVKAGSKGFRVVYWRLLEHVSPQGEVTEIPLMRYYTVFNIEQTTGIPQDRVPLLGNDFKPIEECEQVVRNMPNPPNYIDTPDAFYERTTDTIGLPLKCLFASEADYYATAYHEMCHATGHPRRLNRDNVFEKAAFNEEYSREELVAEIGASILCAHTRIAPRVIDSQASYIAHWLGLLKNDRKLIIGASAAAQKAANYILGEYEIDYNNCTFMGDYHECHESFLNS